MGSNSLARHGILVVGIVVSFHEADSVSELRGWAAAVIEKDLDRALRDSGVHDVSIEKVTTRFREAS